MPSPLKSPLVTGFQSRLPPIDWALDGWPLSMVQRISTQWIHCAKQVIGAVAVEVAAGDRLPVEVAADRVGAAGWPFAIVHIMS